MVVNECQPRNYLLKLLQGCRLVLRLEYQAPVLSGYCVLGYLLIIPFALPDKPKEGPFSCLLLT